MGKEKNETAAGLNRFDGIFTLFIRVSLSRQKPFV